MTRNVVLICVDQWRGDCLSAAGHPDVQTPALDGLAAGGTMFERAYSATPTCVPARVSLMTGLKPGTHGRVGYQDGVRFNIPVTLPGAFGQAGYHTQAIGKMHVGCNSVHARPWQFEERLHPTNWVINEAERWLHRRDPEVPFFLFLSFHRPHAPYDPPAWAWDMYARRELARPAHGDWTDRLSPWRRNDDPEAHVADFREDTVQRARVGYYGLMTHIDHQIFRFLDLLGEAGLRDDTIVAFVSDHGDMMGDHGMWRKGYAYEGSSRIPFLLNGPGVPEGRRCDDLIELRDVLPTLLDAAGLDIPDSVEGRPALGAAHGTGAREYLHGEHTIFGQSIQWIVTRGWKYVWWSDDGHEQLFDLSADPLEERDLAAAEPHREQLQRCRGYLVESLRDREEGFVSGGELVPGRPVTATLAAAHGDEITGHGPS